MTREKLLELCDYLECNDASLEAQCEAAAFIRKALAKLDKIAALQQKTESHDVDCLCSDCAALDDLDEALAQPEQPKVRTGDCLLVGVCASEGHKIQKAQPEQEPVAWMKEGWGPDCGPYIEFYRDDEIGWRDRKEWTPLYTTPPQRTWVGLTDEDVVSLCREFMGQFDKREFIKATEFKLKEKNA